MTNSDALEKELICELKNKDRKAWKKLYELYSGKLFYICSRYLNDPDSRNDVIQEGFVKMLHSINRFEWRGAGSLRAWMSQIIVNECLKYIKANSKKETLLDPVDFPEIPNEEAELKFEEVPQQAILNMIQSLPNGYRTIFNLYVFENKSHKEIALLLGIGPDSSASQLYRAKQSLAEMIRKYKLSKQVLS
jgi:RNA polymerase sigma-70 factor (ECF subfamily)